MGTVTVSAAALAAVMAAARLLTNTLLLASTGSKPEPLSVTAAPWSTTWGEKPDSVGGPWVTTWNAAAVLAVPSAVVTLTGPVVAPWGTATVIWVALTTVGVAAAPLNDTWVVFKAPKAVPAMVTTVPGAARPGVTWATTRVLAGLRLTERMLPTASYS